jgi:hypothetical protein
MAQSSSPTADAVIARYIISINIEVPGGNCIFKELNPNPASIAAIPSQIHYQSVGCLPEIEL